MSIDPEVALKTGLIAGLLIEARMDGLLLLVPVPRLDEDGNFTNVIELVRDGVVEFTITVEKWPPPRRYGTLDAAEWEAETGRPLGRLPTARREE